MKSKTKLYTGLFLIMAGLATIFFGLFVQGPLLNKESDFPYIFGIVFVIAGIKCLVDYRKENPREK